MGFLGYHKLKGYYFGNIGKKICLLMEITMTKGIDYNEYERSRKSIAFSV